MDFFEKTLTQVNLLLFNPKSRVIRKITGVRTKRQQH